MNPWRFLLGVCLFVGVCCYFVLDPGPVRELAAAVVGTAAGSLFASKQEEDPPFDDGWWGR